MKHAAKKQNNKRHPLFGRVEADADLGIAMLIAETEEGHGGRPPRAARRVPTRERPALPECRSPHPTVLVARRQWIGRRRARHDAQATQPVERLRHLVHLIVVLAVREAATLINERFDPWRQGRVREVHVAALHLRTDGLRARYLAAFGSNRHKADHLML